MAHAFLQELGIEKDNAGTYANGWREPSGNWLESRSPHDGTVIGRVALATEADYEAALVASVDAFHAWREWPAPKRGEVVRLVSEALREKREAVNTAILKEEEEKAKIQKDLSILTDRLSKINEALARRVMARNEYDKTIQETEAAYMKILESSQTLLHVLKRETVNLTKKKQYSS